MKPDEDLIATPRGWIRSAMLDRRLEPGNKKRQLQRRPNVRLRTVAVPAVALSVLAILASSAAIGGSSWARPLQRLLGRLCQYTLATAGGSFTKFGQILATRPDLFNAEFLVPLSRLYATTSAATATETFDELPGDCRTLLEGKYQFDTGPSHLGGSVAQIHRGWDRSGGRFVAVKAVKAGARRAAIHDVVLIRRIALRLAQLPLLSRIPLAKATAVVCRRVVAQLNMASEARNQIKMTAVLAHEDVYIPVVVDVVGKHILVMEWLDDLRMIDAVADADLREELVTRILRILYRMIFTHGVIHCDLHPGNILVDRQYRPVLLDFGLVGHLSKEARCALAKFFLSIAANDPVSGVEVILETAERIAVDSDINLLEARLASLFESVSRRKSGDFQLGKFVQKLFAIQASCGITSTEQFTLPILALVVLEGMIKQLAPNVDFQREAMPIIVDTLTSDERGNIRR